MRENPEIPPRPTPSQHFLLGKPLAGSGGIRTRLPPNKAQRPFEMGQPIVTHRRTQGPYRCAKTLRKPRRAGEEAAWAAAETTTGHGVGVSMLVR